jgi:hypothetical protein
MMNLPTSGFLPKAPFWPGKAGVWRELLVFCPAKISFLAVFPG